MKPPYDITPQILRLVAAVSEKTGQVNAKFLLKTNPVLRKQNQIKTIHASLGIEGNTLSENQVTAILENKRVLGPKKDVQEVKNAWELYSQIKTLHSSIEKDFLKAHKILMKDLDENAGRYRNKGVGIAKGSVMAHVAPAFKNVPYLMKDLFTYLKDKNEIPLVKSCVFHYEMEFIHPFTDGNGRMGRLWQTLILMEAYPVFEFLPFETLVSKNQAAYYKALAVSDKQGKATVFIEYMLTIIDRSLAELLENVSKKLTEAERIQLFLEQATGQFSRKDYLYFFKDISTATASRDLKNATEQKLINKQGEKKNATYSKSRG